MSQRENRGSFTLGYGDVVGADWLRVEIGKSKERSRAFGVDVSERNVNQECLTPAGLAERQRRNGSLLDVAVAQIREYYHLLSPDDFMIALVDSDGYILHQEGSDRVKAVFAERNCSPGFRWTERDVGTSAISLCLELRRPVQLNDKDHYCKRAHGFTSSAAPIIGRQGELEGVLVVGGDAALVHQHTLVMVTSTAHSIERELKVMRRNRELALHVGFLDRVIESASMGLMVLDADSRIWKVNRKGAQILKRDDLIGKPVSVLGDLEFDIRELRERPSKWVNRECVLRSGRQTVQVIATAQPVTSSEGEMLGAVLALEETARIRKLATDMAGTRAFFTFDMLIGESACFREAVDMARRAAETDSFILLQGETGTGKELFAQAIHNGGARRAQPFVPINCGAIPGELLESELFGYVEGAFTGASRGGKPGKFEWANGGTILLDEIGDMPHDMQVKLLRVLQTGEVYRIGARKPVIVDTRIIACTHVDLARAVRDGRFREDLFYRLNVFSVGIPPLRERGEDVLLLSRFFLSHFADRTPELSRSAAEALLAHTWPGNVRELENTLQRAAHLCDGETLRVRDLGLAAAPGRRRGRRFGTLEEMEREMIATTLAETGTNMAATAKSLGISRATLYRKVKTFGI